MMKLKNISKKKLNGKTIMLLTESMQGALKAGHFAINHFYDEETRIILLETFFAPKYGRLIMKNLSLKLKEIAKEDLTRLKNTLIKESGIPPESILKVAIEGGLTSIMKQEFSNDENLSVVIGTDWDPVYDKISIKQVMAFIRTTNIRPIFLIGDTITLIDRTMIMIISGNANMIPETIKKCLVQISERDNIPIEYVTDEKKSTASIPDGTARFFSKPSKTNSQSLSRIERIYLEWGKDA